MKKNINNILIILSIIFGIFLLYNFGVIKPFAIVGEEKLLVFNDLNSIEKEALKPMFVEQESGHIAKKIEGTFDISSQKAVFDDRKSMSGIVCGNSIPFILSDHPLGHCYPTFINNFLNKSGGNRIYHFKFYYGEKCSCSDINVSKLYSVCIERKMYCGDKIEKCALSYHSLATWGILPQPVTNCHYEERSDGYYTVYDAEATFDIFCNPAKTLNYGLHKYSCVEDGRKVKKELIKENIILTSYAYTQYNKEPIKFTVRLKDATGIDIYPEKITNLKGFATLTNGQIISQTVTYLGKGEYEVKSTVIGNGDLVGGIEFKYLEDTIKTQTITIRVEDVAVNIDTSFITPVANLYETNKYQISIYDTLGNIITPDNLWIQVTYPDGVTKETITFDKFTKVKEGTYEFSFYFNQVEKYTFDIYADKMGFVRGSAKASVSSASEEEKVVGPTWFPYLKYIVPIGFIAFFIIAYILFRRRR